MGIKVAWDNPEKTALRFDYDQQWDWSDFLIAAPEAK